MVETNIEVSNNLTAPMNAASKWLDDNRLPLHAENPKCMYMGTSNILNRADFPNPIR